ncbi:MAG: MarR family transcriptional regulator [Lachnospiraceae bacterium]|nr:MarR family transcriptional regulator [Lachnospiraceae bacterium]
MQLQDMEVGFGLTNEEIEEAYGRINDTRLQIAMTLGMLDHIQKNKINRKLEKVGLTTTQLQVLIYILYNNANVRELTAKELETRFRVSNPTMSGILKRLEKKGIIERAPGVRDKRSKQIRIKGEAPDFFSLIEERTKEEAKKMFRDFSDAELERLLQLLRKLLHNFDNTENEE